MDQTRGRLSGQQLLGLRVVGAGLLAATAAIHLDLYLTGYRSIPTIGWLFLLQVIAAFALALAVLATGSRLAAAAGAGFALSTLGGYLLTVWIGLFGFKEIRTTAGIVAGVIEVAAFAVLALLALAPARRRSPAGSAAPPATGSAARDGATAGSSGSLLGRLQEGSVPGTGWVTAGLAVIALAVLVGTVAAVGGGAAAAPGGTLQATQINGVKVVTNAKGFTLYWFVPDTTTKSVCNGSCAAYWPPVSGLPTAGPGVTGHIGTIKRADGSTQATYNGHPLYTYAGDSAPGQATGNNINLNGGLWHEMAASG